MHLKSYPFQSLPFSNLFKSYIKDFNQLTSFYETNPFNTEDINERAGQLSFTGNRQQTVKILKHFNNRFDPDPAAVKNINRLEKDNALAIVTGQQLGLFGGPVFTFYKTISVIHLANRLEKKLDRPVVPVFWLADEDHDYDEVRSATVMNGKGLESFSLPQKKNDVPPVSELHFPEELKALKKKIRSTLIDTDFSDNLWDLLDECFTTGTLFLSGFGNFIGRLFSKHGLVLAGSNDAAVKQLGKGVMKTAVQKANEVRQALEKQSQELAKKYHQQVRLYDSHLFYLDRKQGRTKIYRNGEAWETNNGSRWDSQELLHEIDDHPERFSPDVFLRPILQDTLLPTLGYVGGPGEIAYYGQMKTYYHRFGKKMPVIFPRLSGTFVEPAIVRIFNELPFEIEDYNNRIEDLESEFVDRSETLDIEALFREWKQEMKQVSDSYKSQIKSVDETLVGALEKVQAHHVNELDELKGKVYRAVKKREQTQLERIRRIQQHLFPERNLQERTLSGIYYMNKFGPDIWDRLLDEMKGLESLNEHQLIYL